MAKVTVGGRTYDVEVRGDTVVVDGNEFPVKVRDDKEYVTVRAGTVDYRVQLPPEGERESGMTVHVDYRPFVFEYEGRLGGGAAARAASAPRPAGGRVRAGQKGAVTAQLSGKVLRVMAKAGDQVNAGDVLLVVEAMKMENEIKAPAAGTVKELPVSEGQQVSEGDVLVVIE